jgi:hypothetical protein
MSSFRLTARAPSRSHGIRVRNGCKKDFGATYLEQFRCDILSLAINILMSG